MLLKQRVSPMKKVIELINQPYSLYQLLQIVLAVKQLPFGSLNSRNWHKRFIVSKTQRKKRKEHIVAQVGPSRGLCK